jgi:hypothetical protein
MSLLLIIGITLFLAFAGISWWLARGVWPGSRREPVTPEWLQEISAERYRPMGRLLSEEDYQFVRSHAKADAALWRKLRSERRRIFRVYLRSLQRDFDRVCSVLTAVVAHAPEDRSELNLMLTRQRLAFRLGVLRIHGVLFLHALGLPATVDARALVGCFDGLRLEMRSALVAAGTASA